MRGSKRRLRISWETGFRHQGWEPANFPVFHHFIGDPDTTAVEELVTDILLPLASSQESSRD
jgi:hypothetical protein